MSEAVPDKREVIRQAAMNVFSRRGFHESTMEDVAQEAGVGKGTVYLYFPGKQALMEDIFRYTIAIYVEAVDTMCDDGQRSLREQLEGIVLQVLTMVEMNQQQAGFFLEGATGMSDEFKSWVIGVKRMLLDRFVSALEKAQDRDEIPPVDAEIWAHLIAGGINSLITTALWGGGWLDANPSSQLAQRVVDQWWAGLAGKKA